MAIHHVGADAQQDCVHAEATKINGVAKQ